MPVGKRIYRGIMNILKMRASGAYGHRKKKDRICATIKLKRKNISEKSPALNALHWAKRVIFQKINFKSIYKRNT